MGSFWEVVGSGGLSKKSKFEYYIHSRNPKRDGVGGVVKCAFMNTVYGTNTDLSFIENFIEPTKI